MIDEIMEDEKVQQIFQLLEAGNSREEVSDFFQQDWKTLYIYMNRKGFRWDKEQETFVLKNTEPKENSNDQALVMNTKAAQIVRMLDVKHPNIRQVASKQGFETVEAMGTYMKLQGYVWNDELNNYEYRTNSETELAATTSFPQSDVGTWSQSELIHFLLLNQKKLVQLLTSTSSIQTYKFKGTKVNKTLTLASSAATLLEDYQKEYNMTQRSIIETALAEFFERHGYEEQLRVATTN